MTISRPEERPALSGRLPAAALLVFLLAACRTTYPVRRPLPSPPPTPTSTARIVEAPKPKPPDEPKESSVARPPAPEPPPVAAPPARSVEAGPRTIRPAPPLDAPGSLRVALATDRDRLRIGGFDETYRFRIDSGELVLRAPIEASIRNGAAPAPTSWRLQVASFTDRAKSDENATAATAQLGLPARVGDASIAGTYPVLVGEFPTREAAIAARTRVASLAGSFPVATTDVPPGEAAFELEDVRGDRFRVAGREIDILPAEGANATWGGDSWRGALRVRVGTKGKLHLLNVLPLEAYLPGVVPAEMGPKQFGEIEALKAQAIAARSYALRRKGESQAEGYDLCATPRCQVYKGMAAEDPLTTRAVVETAGMVVTWQGKIADTLFTSTCGGHTDAVSNVFPERSEPYLVAVPCSIEGKMLPPITGAAGPSGSEAFARGAAFGRWLEARGIHAPRELGVDYVFAASNAIRRSLGAPPLPGRPKGLGRNVLVPALLEAFRLGDAARVLDRGPDRILLAGDAGDDELYARSVELLRRFGWDVFALDGPPAGRLPLTDWLSLAGGIAESVGILDRIEGRLLPDPANGWMIRPNGGGAEWIPPAGGRPWLLWWKNAGQFAGTPSLTPKAIDRVVAWAAGPELLALGVERSEAGGGADRDSSWSRWVRRFRKSQLLAKIRERKQIPDLVSLEVLSRSDTGRITKLRIETGGEPLVLRGLDIRFHLDLPESLAAIVPAAPIGDDPTWLFLGRGWGHGVGLCQWGAYGMALAGHDHRAILARYFPGTELRQLEEPK